MSKLRTYYDTIKYLKPVQIYSRLSGKLKSGGKPPLCEAPTHREIAIAIPEIDLNEEYVQRFAPEEIPGGKVKLLNRSFALDFSEDTKAKMSPLEWFNLQYFEYAVALAYMFCKTGKIEYAEAFERAYRTYLAADLPYSAYVISLHIPNLLISLEIFGDALETGFVEELNNEIYRQYRYLASHRETYLLGNHYFENLKTLTIASYYFKEDAKCAKYMQKLKEQTDEQVLHDGMHFELSPMYHKLILEGLLRLSAIEGLPDSEWIPDSIQQMINALGMLENGINRTPLFNDSGDNVAKSADALFKAAEIHCGITPQKMLALPDAGYYRIEADEAVLLIDCGRIGPDYMPGHGHCDCLSFELFIGGEPVIVNSGTYQYQGEKRKYFRSTKAHNTVVTDGNEQSQCWGEHRVAKRICGVSAKSDGNHFEGRYTNFRGQTHVRSISVENKVISVADITHNAKSVKSYIRIPCAFELTDELEVKDRQGNAVCVIEPFGCDAEIIREGEKTAYAPEFGKLEKCTCVEFAWLADADAHGYLIKY